MKVLFIGLASHYTEGMTYQDNMLAKQCLQDGNEVFYISDDRCYCGGELVRVNTGYEVLSDGLKLYRVKYDYIVNPFVTDKLRSCKKIYEIIELIAPDILFIHGPNTIAVWDIVKYLKKHPKVLLYADSHADYYTSGTNFFSRAVLHGVIYRITYNKCLKYADKLFCISVNCMKFAEEIYKIPKHKLELYLLGGEVWEKSELDARRRIIRRQYNWSDTDIVFFQAGKIDAAKCLLESLEEFIKFTNADWKYIVAGSVAPDIEEDLEKLRKQDSRVDYIGWKSGNELMDCLAACDVYLQPGKVSALAQNAICMGAAVALRKFEDYKIMVDGNGWLLDKPEDVYKVFKDISEKEIDLNAFRNKSYEQAQELLSYEKRTERLYCQEVLK